jgi:hypothetical protein
VPAAVLVIPTAKGSREIALRDSRQATEVSHYFAALRRFLREGDESALKAFRLLASRRRIVRRCGC